MAQKKRVCTVEHPTPERALHNPFREGTRGAPGLTPTLPLHPAAAAAAAPPARAAGDTDADLAAAFDEQGAAAGPAAAAAAAPLTPEDLKAQLVRGAVECYRKRERQHHALLSTAGIARCLAFLVRVPRHTQALDCTTFWATAGVFRTQLPYAI